MTPDIQWLKPPALAEVPLAKIISFSLSGASNQPSRHPGPKTFAKEALETTFPL